MSEEKLLWVENWRKIEKIRHSLKITEPTSAWDIMEWVIQQVKEEPRRLWMGTWGGSANGSYENEPPCGTIACFNGWSNLRMNGEFWSEGGPAGAALAGWNREDGHDPEGHELRNRLYYDLFVDDVLTEMEPGTPEIVAAVEKRAREIMAEFETRLKSVIIHPDGHFERRTETAAP